MTEAQSPCGSAWHSDPTSVPRLRTSGSAISGAAAAMTGWVSLSRPGVLQVGVTARRADKPAAVRLGPVE